MANILLASSSPYRKELLLRLGITFDTCSPDIDETSIKDENAEQLVRRLAIEKSKAMQDTHPNTLIIGSDQVAVLGNKILTKPGDHTTAIEQLKASSGKMVKFYTGLCLLNTATQQAQTDVITYVVTFRQLNEEQIENYLRQEQPYNCAGSFKSEGLGVALFEKMAGDDPSALIGLPLIRLTTMLTNEGVDIPGTSD